MWSVRFWTAVALSVVVALIGAAAIDREPWSLGELAATVGVASLIVLGIGALTELAVRRLRPRTLAFVLAGALFGPLAAAGSLGIPATLIELSEEADWAYDAGREVSLGVIVAGTGLAVLVAWLAGRRATTVVLAGVLTLALGTLGHDVGVRFFDPDWCFEAVEVEGDGRPLLEGLPDCPVVLPAEDPYADL